jgi:hypothetical protein
MRQVVAEQGRLAELPPSDQSYRRDLGDGLRLRWSTPEDLDRLVALYCNVYRPREDAPPNPLVGPWVRDMMGGRHPHITAYDFALVEDTRTENIVAATCLLANDVTYEHIPFTMGRPEVVATEIPYRNRSLQRAIFGLIHARSAARGHLVQGITGIPNFYRQFGYEFAIELEATRQIYFSALPLPKPGEPAPYGLRPATEDDIPLLVGLSSRERACWQIATVLDEAAWRWMALDSDPAAGNIGATYMATRASDGATIGYVLLSRIRSEDSVGVWGMAIREGLSLAEVAPHALRAARELVDAFPSRPDDSPPATRFRLEMGPGHALFDALGPDMTPPIGSRYAWWMRIPDMPAFIRLIAPVLEQRLAHSVLAGRTSDFCIDFYRGGLRLAIAQGKLVTVEPWQKPLWGESQAAFPPLIFTQLLLGYRSFADLAYAHIDVRAEGIHRILLETLFPPRPSYMLPLD